MQELLLKDYGNQKPDPSEVILNDELISYLSGLNPVIGSKDDVRFSEYSQFLESISQTSIIKIDPESISTGKFADLDLTGENDNYVIEEIDDSSFFNKAIINNKTGNLTDENLLNIISAMTLVTPFTTEGIVFDKDYAPVMEFITPFSNIKNEG
jgi:hypothetical protein